MTQSLNERNFFQFTVACWIPEHLQLHAFLYNSNSVTMGGATEDLVVPFLGALQASIAVLLTIFYGVIAAQFNLISEASAKDVSKACVRLFLPALLISNVGSQLHLDTVRISWLNDCSNEERASSWNDPTTVHAILHETLKD